MNSDPSVHRAGFDGNWERLREMARADLRRIETTDFAAEMAFALVATLTVFAGLGALMEYALWFHGV